MKYILYATNKDGDGHTSEIGRFDDLGEIEIRCGHFSKDVVVTIDVVSDLENS